MYVARLGPLLRAVHAVVSTAPVVTEYAAKRVATQLGVRNLVARSCRLNAHPTHPELWGWLVFDCCRMRFCVCEETFGRPHLLWSARSFRMQKMHI